MRRAIPGVVALKRRMKCAAEATVVMRQRPDIYVRYPYTQDLLNESNLRRFVYVSADNDEGGLNDRFAIGMLLNKLGGDLTATVLRATEGGRNRIAGSGDGKAMPTTGELLGLMGKLNGLARGFLDRNVTVGFAVCATVYQG
ncbi:hypothetical protein CYMTET_9211 [Cymbomonas tetramitiformis]|uniref:Uncharacterized protein n=1 Tax=Cymbomonas tetramitiformis TaxID=36881 RepID=A0AAE0GRX3_9CHLO|nr:hypothetical protein CYMTET_9211 [Cymbomonas tetramitiformis]